MFAFPLIIVLGIFVMVKQNKAPEVKTTVSPNIVSVQNTIVTNTDTDTDGVPDWQEIIWKTDPAKANTYGIPDKEYIAKKSTEEKNATSTISGSTNSTEELSQQLFTEYMRLQQAGQLNETTIQTMTERIAQNIAAKPSDALYTLKDIKTFPDSDTDKLQTYANTLISLQKSYVQTYDKLTAGKTVTIGDPDFGNSMVLASQLYTKLATDLIKVAAPEGAAQFHLAYTNSIKQSAQGLLEFSHFTDDPINSMAGIQRHTAGEELQTSAINNITNFLSQNGIIGFTLSAF